MEAQLEEANEVAKMSNQKFEDAGRKLKVSKLCYMFFQVEKFSFAHFEKPMKIRIRLVKWKI